MHLPPFFREAGKLELSAANSELALDFTLAARTYSLAAAQEDETAAVSTTSRPPAPTSAQQGQAIPVKAQGLYQKAVQTALQCDTYDLGLQLFEEWGLNVVKTQSHTETVRDGTQLESVRAKRQQRAAERLTRQQGRGRTALLLGMHSEYVATAARRSARALKREQALQLAGLMPFEARVKLMERWASGNVPWAGTM